MLTDLRVEGLGVIDAAELSLPRACTALTGETGAGKTLLVAALSLLLGGRADKTLVRRGALEARVEARFLVPAGHPAVAVLAEHGLVDDPASGDVELVMTRTVGADGRGKARVNGRLATIAVLGRAGAALAEIAGQHEHGRLTDPAHQRALLDAYAGPAVQELAAELASAVRAAAAAERRAAAARAGERERERELDALRHEIREIEAVAPAPGESAEIARAAARLEHAETLARGLHEAAAALKGEGGAGESIARARDEVAALVATDGSLDALAERLESAAVEVADVADELTARVVAPDPDALEEARARLAALARLRRKYGDDEAEVVAYLGRARARTAALEAAAGDADASERDAARERARADELAARLSAARAAAAPRLAAAVEELLAELALAGARVDVGLEPRALYEGGAETVELRVAANPGDAPLPLAKVASGGELSRIALALRLLTTTGSVCTMVFDEVDAGVGGRAAQTVGRLLSRLAAGSGAQVVVVTHLPQVAAYADDHVRVVKAGDGERVAARFERVEGAERVAELSRMLAGLPESARAREHAQELLELAAREAVRA
ncbi:MAG TPA: DNA repair protein RecN [Actinomycetota bacterium]|nr:DNA repair protein RecN [Actinomycetota bacterium]